MKNHEKVGVISIGVLFMTSYFMGMSLIQVCITGVILGASNIAYAEAFSRSK